MSEIPKQGKSIIRWFNDNYRTRGELQSAYDSLKSEHRALQEDLEGQQRKYVQLDNNFTLYRDETTKNLQELETRMKQRKDRIAILMEQGKKTCLKYDGTIDTLLKKISKQHIQLKLAKLDYEALERKYLSLRNKYLPSKKKTEADTKKQKPSAETVQTENEGGLVSALVNDMRGL